MLIETKIALGVAFILLIALCLGYFTLHLLNAGKAECVASLESQALQEQHDAEVTESNWRKAAQKADAAHQSELAAMAVTRFAAGTMGVSNPTRRAIVPISTAPTRESQPASRAGFVCAPVLSESPDRLRDDFAAAQAADRLAADYRDIYNAWPLESK